MRIALALGLACALLLSACTIEEDAPSTTAGTCTSSGIATNEWAINNSGGCESSRWEATSGSLMTHNGYGWTGVPDYSPGVAYQYSSPKTGSAVLRVISDNNTLGDNTMETDVRVDYWCDDSDTPACQNLDPWDGLAIWPRYQTANDLYKVDLFRPDGRVAISKKCSTGGDELHYLYPDNTDPPGEPYVFPNDDPAPLDTWVNVGTSIETAQDGDVTITGYVEGDPVITWTDDAQNPLGEEDGCEVYDIGRIGFRWDNANAEWTNAIYSDE